MLCNSYILCNKINFVLKYSFDALKNHFIFCDNFLDNPGHDFYLYMFTQHIRTQHCLGGGGGGGLKKEL